jgi:hypothetical protein
VDLLEACRRVASTALETACPFVFAGTYMNMDDRPELAAAPGSASRARIQPITVTVVVTERDMIRSLARYVRLSSDQSERELLSVLARLQGRPYFFYDRVFAPVFYGPPCPLAERLRTLGLLTEASYKQLVAHHGELFAAVLGNSFATDPMLSRNSALLLKLFLSHVFDGGKCTFTSEQVHQLVKTSVSPVSLSPTSGWEIDLSAEPVARAAIRSAGVNTFAPALDKFSAEALGVLQGAQGVEGVGRDALVGYLLEKWVPLVLCLSSGERTLSSALEGLGLTAETNAQIPLLRHVVIRSSQVLRRGAGDFANVVRQALETGELVAGDGGLPAPDLVHWGTLSFLDPKMTVPVQIRWQLKTGKSSLLEALRNLNYDPGCAARVTVRVFATLFPLNDCAQAQVRVYNEQFPFQPILLLHVGGTTTGRAMIASKTAAETVGSALSSDNVRLLPLNGRLNSDQSRVLGALGRPRSTTTVRATQDSDAVLTPCVAFGFLFRPVLDNVGHNNTLQPLCAPGAAAEDGAAARGGHDDDDGAAAGGGGHAALAQRAAAARGGHDDEDSAAARDGGHTA